MHFCFSIMCLCFGYRLFFVFSGIGSVAEPYTDKVKLKENSSMVRQKEEFLADNPHEGHNGSNKTKYMVEKIIHSQKFNKKCKNITKYCKNSSPFLPERVISYILSLSHDKEMIVSSKNISEQLKSKENESHKNSSRRLLHKTEQMSVKHPGNSGIHHTMGKREAVDNRKRETDRLNNYSIVFVNHTKNMKYLSNVNKSIEVLKYTTEITIQYDKDLKISNDTEIGFKSMKYCKQYQKYALEKTYATPLLPVLKPFVVGEQQKCRILPLVVGGTEASRGEFPHMAALGYNTGRQTHFLCGASLISERYVLTAAHCAKTKWGFPVVVRFGVLNVLTERGQTILVDDVVVHPNYREPSIYNDIALVRIAEKLRLSHNLRPACLPEINSDSDNPGAIATAIGWGKVGYNLLLSPNLLKVKLKVISLPKCEETFVSKERSIRLQHGISKNMICASGYLDPLHDTCQGDSGGPLQITYADDESGYCMHQIIGITSFGKQCGTGMPAVYTRVSAYINWIESIVWPL